MSDVSHRGAAGPVELDRVTDDTGEGTPEGVHSAVPGSTYRNTDGGAGTTFYVKESGSGNTGWVAAANADSATSLATRVTTAEAAVDVLEADVDALESRVTVTEADIVALEAADAVLVLADTALDARLDTAESDITALEGADTALDGRLDVLEARKSRTFLWFGGAVVTAATNDRYANTPGQSTSPIGAAALRVPSPVTGNIVAMHYMVTTAHTTNTVVVSARLNGVNQTGVGQNLTVTSTSLVAYQLLASPIAVTRGDQLSCHVNHTGATNLANLAVAFEIEY